ncbi:MAG: class I SAM-dependent methyltransferase [Polymorphobacter sp.]
MEREIYDRIKLLETSHWWFVGRRDIIRAVIGRLALPRDAAIVEVGCGTGGNIPMLQEYGHVAAMEPDSASRAYVTAHTGVTVQTGWLPDDLPFAAASYDLVCAFDVIEHVDDDAGTVAALARLLKPGGVLLATVPAYQAMWSHQDELHHHKRRYQRDAFAALVTRAGLKLEVSSYFNSFLLAPAWAQRMVKRLTGSTAPDDAMPPAWLNSLLTGIFRSERGLVAGAGLPAGVSIVVAARKP